MAPEQQFSTVYDWLLSRRPEGFVFDEDTDLIESRVVDSFRFVELLLLIEEVSGIDTAPFSADLDKFRSVSAIKQNFFSNA